MAAHSPSLEQLSLTDLEAACRRETNRYRQDKASDARFCLEIFRRALRHQLAPSADPPTEAVADDKPVNVDEDACAMLVRIYTPYIRAQLKYIDTPTASLEDLEQQVWLRFWQAANTGLTFTSLAGALDYLTHIIYSVRIEAQRQAWKRQREMSLNLIGDTTGEEALPDAGADPFDDYIRQRVRARYREVITDPLEYRIFRMRYSLGLPPREIADALKREGIAIKDRPPTADAVSRLLELIYRRLRQDPELRDLLGGD
jgi:DNA-directed RNA polymerase specialized sigma24 family protein